MTNSFIDEALKEKARLTSQLEKSPAFRRLALVNKLISDYGSEETSHRHAGDKFQQDLGVVPKTKGGKVEYFARQCIAENGGFALMSSIHNHLESKGLEMSKPNLSSYLSGLKKHKDFDCDPEKGWFIK